MRSSKVAVMEIGTSKIGVYIGAGGINSTINVLGSYEQEYGGFYDGEIVEPEKLVDEIGTALTKAQASAGENIKKLFVGVPPDFCIIKNKSFIQSFGEKCKLNETMLMEIYEQSNDLAGNKDYVLISCTPIYFTLDDGRKVINPIGEKTSRLSGEICYIYSEKEFIAKINVALRKFGISVVEYVSATLAENTYLLSDSVREHQSIIVDCGYISTSVSVTQGNGLKLLSSFSVGGGQVVSDLSECLKISYKMAEELKKEIVLSVVPALGDGYEVHNGSNVVPISMVEANDIVCARLDMICSLINKCLESIPKNEIYKMPFYLTGGGICFIKGAKDYLSKTFGVNVEILSPPSLQYSKPNFSVWLGLLNMALEQEQRQKKNKLVSFFKRITKR